MIYLGPQKKFKAKKKVGGKIVVTEYDCRVIYTDTYNEMMNIVHKMGNSTDYIRKHANYFSCILFKNYFWKPLWFKKKYNFQVEELTLMQESEFVEKKNTDYKIEKQGF